VRELNWKPDQTVQVTVLGNTAVNATARIQECAGKRMRLIAGPPVNTGTAVRLEWEGQLLLAEVENTDSSGFWVEIHHMLLNASELNWQDKGWQR